MVEEALRTEAAEEVAPGKAQSKRCPAVQEQDGHQVAHWHQGLVLSP